MDLDNANVEIRILKDLNEDISGEEDTEGSNRIVQYLDSFKFR